MRRLIKRGSPGDKFVAIPTTVSICLLFFVKIVILKRQVFRMNAQLVELAVKEKLKILTEKQRAAIYRQILDLRSGSTKSLSQPQS